MQVITIFALTLLTIAPVLGGPVERRQRNGGGFGSSFNGQGEPIFGNAGEPCTVGREEGTCDQFGRCAQFIPPNENSILNQGREVAECIAGGPVGTA